MNDKHSQKSIEKIRLGNTGKKRTAEHKRNYSLSKLGEKNPHWAGYEAKIGMEGLHVWIRRRLPRPLVCEMCKIKPPLDLANVTGVYNRELKNWKHYCRKCHMLSDGRMNNLVQNNPDSKIRSNLVKKAWITRRSRT